MTGKMKRKSKEEEWTQVWEHWSEERLEEAGVTEVCEIVVG